jgi:hypothetical protein
MGLTNYPNGITSFGIPIYGPGNQDISGSTYFVDNNSGNDTNKGGSWDDAFKTLAKAVTVSNADIARGSDRWARRNTIYYCADTETADLVAFPNKCDVIGCGSYDANSKPGITGNHVPVNAGNYGTRFINIWFKAPADASPIVTLASSSSGIQFIGCTFSATATTTIGIQATASPFLKVIDCRFEGAFVTSYITFGTGEAGGTEILRNRMVDSAAAGIVAGSGMTSSWASIIDGNMIEAATLVIDDDADLFYITDNRLISLASATTGYVASIDINLARAAGNYITTVDIATILPVLDTTAA